MSLVTRKMEQLRQLTDALDGLARGQQGRWLEICPPIDRMQKGLREAIAHSHEPETPHLLGLCWDALSESGRTESAIAQHCQKHHGTSDAQVVARLYRNARVRIATGCAAVEARRFAQDPGAMTEMVGWLMRAASLFGGKAETPLVNCGWPQTDAATVTRQACEALAIQGMPMATARLWTLELLDAGDPEICHSIAVPVAGCDGKGFLLNLRLSAMQTPGGGLVEHPEMALRTFGATMLETLQTVSQCSQVTARWELRPREKQFETLALDGPSLGGALAVGLRVLKERLPYDSSCLILAQIKCDRLEAAGHEQEKLEAACEPGSGIRRAAVGWGTRIRSRIPDYAAKGVEIVELPDLAHAMEFATGELVRLRAFVRAEIDVVLEDAQVRLDRQFPDLAALTRLLVDVQVARGLRPKLSKGELEALERQRARGDYTGFEQLERRKFDFRAAEAQRELPEARRTDRWEDLRDRLSRTAVLSDPGFGKTTLLWWEVGRRCEEGLAAADVENTKFGVFLRCTEVAEALTKHDGFLDAVLARLRERHALGRELEPLLRKKLANGDCLIALDALDEVSDSRRLKETLQDFARNREQARILVSSRLAGFAELPFVADEDHVEILRLEEPEMERAVRAWLDDPAAADALWSQTGQQPHLRELLHGPLLLRLACQLAETVWRREKKIPQWERRADLYWGFLETAADTWFERYVESGGQNRTLHGLFLKFAARVALSLWRRDARQAMWSAEELASAAADAEWKREDPVKDLEWAGLLAPVYAEPGAPRMFTHRTFGEYLCGRALAEQAGDPATWEFVDQKVGDPAWDEVIVSMAGESDSAGARRLLTLLADQKKDDFVRRHLALAARSLPELSTEARAVCAKGVDRITTECAKLSAEVLKRELEGAFPLLLRSLPALARTNAKVGRVPFLDWLGGMLSQPEPFVALTLVSYCGPLAARAEVMDRLVESLRDSNDDVRTAAAEALGALGPGAARTEVVNRLVASLRDPNDDVRSVAVEALGRLGPGAARAEVVDRLLKSLLDSNSQVRSTAAEALGRLGPGAARAEVVDRLLELTRDPNWNVRWAAAEAFGALWPEAACAEVVDRLVEWLRDPDWNVRWAAAEALGRLGPEVARAEVVDRLMEWLCDPDSHVRRTTAYALGRLGPVATRAEVVDRLVELLRDSNEHVRFAAADTLARLGPQAAPRGGRGPAGGIAS